MGERTLPYSGADRRGVAWVPRRSPFGPVFFIALALCLGVGSLLLVALPFDSVGSVALPLDGLLGAAAAIMTVAAVASFFGWRFSGFAPAVWIGTGLALLGLIGIGWSSFFSGVEEPPSGLRSVVPASVLVATFCFAYAARQPAVDSRIRPIPVVGAAALAMMALSSLLDSLDAELDMSATDLPWPSLFFAAMWLGLAGVALDRARRPGGRWYFAWLTLMAISLALGALVMALASITDQPVPATTVILPLLGALSGLRGTARELNFAFATQRGELLSTQVSAAKAQEKMRAVTAEAEERAHEARNALLAIEGATHTLERNHATLPHDVREALAEAVSAEIARLQKLISPNNERPEAAFYVVADSISPAVTAARACGVEVFADVSPEIMAFGVPSALTQVMQNLIENARRHAPGSPVGLTAGLVDQFVEVRVADQGPGVPVSERDKIFERRGRGRFARETLGDGLGLYIARQLMRSQGGDLWVEGNEGGGAVFVVWLPAEGPLLRRDYLNTEVELS